MSATPIRPADDDACLPGPVTDGHASARGLVPAHAGRARVWQGVRRVLAVRLDNLGDVLMTSPALAALRESLPHAHITLLATPSGAAAAAHLPMVDAAWSCRVPWMPMATAADRSGEAALVERLAAGAFDGAVIFTVCTQSALPAALLCRMAGIPLRLAHCRENPYGLLSDWVPDPDRVEPGLSPAQQRHAARHEVARQLALVGAVGLRTHDERLRFMLAGAERQRAAGQLRAVGVPATLPYVVLHPGASAASRRWPAADFGVVARTLAASGTAAVFCGGADEAALIDEALRAAEPAVPWAAPVVSLAGAQTLGELAATIEGADVLVANNSAPAHLAAALGTPVVCLYAQTNPQHTPWRVRRRVLSHDVPCRWCLRSVCPQGHHDCLKQVRPEQVVAAVFELNCHPVAESPAGVRA